MKVVICGSPHSGKSVFIGGLEQCLPRDKYFTFRACPDGEGWWTYQTTETAALRRKGSFTPEFVSWCVNSLNKKGLSPITLVDVGGRMSEQNKSIMACCTHAIVLDRDAESLERWVQFCKEQGLKIIARVLSNYNDTSDNICGSVMSVHHLERGENVATRPAIMKVGEILLTKAARIKAAKKSKNMIKINELAEAIGKMPEMVILPNGTEVKSIKWAGSDLSKVANHLHNTYLGETVQVDGAAPAWLVAAITHELHPSKVELNSPDGYVPVGCMKPLDDGHGANLEFKTTRNGNVLTVLCQQVDPSIPLRPQDLPMVAPPACQFSDVIVLSGRMPNWLAASLAMSYHGSCKAVALFQPNVGATVCWTHSTNVVLGSTL
jgi:CRISPR-associated Csx3 family protein